MIVAIDFDGTIVRSRFPVIQGAMPYAKEAINRLHEQGHYIIIWTCRCGKDLLDAINWMMEQGIKFDRVNDHCPANIAKFGEGGPKVYADIYIDDKNFGGFPGWQSVMEAME